MQDEPLFLVKDVDEDLFLTHGGSFRPMPFARVFDYSTLEDHLSEVVDEYSFFGNRRRWYEEETDREVKAVEITIEQLNSMTFEQLKKEEGDL